MQSPDGKKPEIIVFAGPNGSGKSTIARMAKIIEPYINADDIHSGKECEIGLQDLKEIAGDYVRRIIGYKRKQKNLSRYIRGEVFVWNDL